MPSKTTVGVTVGFLAIAAACWGLIEPNHGYCQDEVDGVIANRHCGIDDRGQLTHPYQGGRIPRIYLTDEPHNPGDHITGDKWVLATDTEGRDDACIIETGELPGEAGGFGGALNTKLGDLTCSE